MLGKELAEAGLTETDILVQKVDYLVGLYLCLFTAALPVFIQNNALKNFSAAVFFIGNALIFIVVSANCSLHVVHAVLIFAYQADIKVGPFQTVSNIYWWAPMVSATIVSMIGDLLMPVPYPMSEITARPIQRLAVGTGVNGLSSGETRDFRILAALGPVPAPHPTQIQRGFRPLHRVCLLLHRWSAYLPLETDPTGSNGPTIISDRNWLPIALGPVFYLLQTALTTALIVWKIWSQSRHRRLASVHVPSISSIMRIIVEGAVIYTAGMFVMVLLRAFNNPAQVIVHACMIPTTGIVFVLMALRIHAVREESKRMLASASLLPTWLVDQPKTTYSGTEPPEQDHHPTSTQTPRLERSNGNPKSTLHAQEESPV
ncbi:hypothetical protein BKA70DRAFT_1410651 [Coprinopsis sp. MPI-PUGE-AT-0042]|nr:hypothetical protein BKA70DRAFT_1410651 [Coprinopsis sp. MPI-PUGE-AT-0042]